MTTHINGYVIETTSSDPSESEIEKRRIPTSIGFRFLDVAKRLTIDLVWK